MVQVEFFGWSGAGYGRYRGVLVFRGGWVMKGEGGGGSELSECPVPSELCSAKSSSGHRSSTIDEHVPRWARGSRGDHRFAPAMITCQ